MMLDLFKTCVPLLVVVLTAALTGYLVPRITKNWQDYQEELKIKTSLVESTNIEVMNILIAAQFAERGANSQAYFDEAYQTWEVQRAALSGRIRVYFHNQQVAKDFDGFSDALTDFYMLQSVTSAELRPKQIRRLKIHFGENATDWDLLEDLDKRAKDFLNWFSAWWTLRQEVLFQKDTVLSRLLAQPIVFLRPPNRAHRKYIAEISLDRKTPRSFIG